MVNIRCITINSGTIRSAVERAPSGAEYRFNRGGFTPVKLKKDADFFLRAGKGQYFELDCASKDADKKKAELAVKLKKEAKACPPEQKNVPGYGLTPEELAEAKNAGTFADVEGIKNKKTLKEYADNDFNIVLSTAPSLAVMKKTFWKEWSGLDDE